MSFHLPKYTVVSEYTRNVTTMATQRIYSKGILGSSYKRAWDAGFTGKGIIVAILDTGIDGNHPDLRGKIIKSINLTNEGLQSSHGTHVAGTIAANGWLLGGAPDASLIDIKVLGRNGGPIATIARAITLAVDNGASVINMSLGGSGLSQFDIQLLNNAIQDAWNRGAICIAAAGNNGTSVNTPDIYAYPASVERAESVAACDIEENLDNISLATFSNENDRVDLAACGKNIVSTVMGGKYAIYSGTSMATPHVSAMAAILSQYIKTQNPGLQGSAFSSALESLLKSHIIKVQKCGSKSSIITIGGKVILEHTATNTCINPKDNISYGKISFGLGFLRYDPIKAPIIPVGTKYYHNGIFLGYQVNQ